MNNLKRGDRVRIVKAWRPAMKSYLYKLLIRKALVGKVKSVKGENASVDFSQTDLPRNGGGKLYGQQAGLKKPIASKLGLRPGQYKVYMLEKV